ncbi:GUN4 domain protein [Calothrix parasitica NIES-267]|uniref:GUN4 domain protein n=1 Tax=Calothrix parasitica NIES-267 TaxID=1973488 RepID=A0A1Z4LPF5_9CYAN|nr:GUN4 domain protein [Calothrix parasitica NIES-267]
MSENQPREFDAVLGGSTSPIFTSAVLGGIEGVKLRLQSKNVDVRFDALWDALNYGEAGLDLIAQRLHDYYGKVSRYAELLLRERGGEKGKQALLDYNPWKYLTTIESWKTQKYKPEVGIVFPFGKMYLIRNKIQFKALIEDPLVKQVEALKFEFFGNNLHRRQNFEEFLGDFVKAQSFFPNLKGLFIGSPFYFNKHSDVRIHNIYPILKAFPKLEFLQFRGYADNENFLKLNLEILEVHNPVDGSFVKTRPLELSNLKTLIIEFNNLTKYNFAKICDLNLPALEYFKLKLGFYICFEDIEDIMSILLGEQFPNLIYLGIDGYADKIIGSLNQSPLMESLRILDLSHAGLKSLENIDLSESSILNRLHTLNLYKNRLSSSMIDELSKLKCQVITHK